VAGLGFKDFQVGEVLTSSDVDGYLMSQAVMRFADSTARGSALGTAPGTAVALAEGMVSYLDDTNSLEVYTGSQWASVGGFSASTAVTATDATWAIPALADPIVRVTVVGGGGGAVGAATSARLDGSAGSASSFVWSSGTVSAAGGDGGTTSNTPSATPDGQQTNNGGYTYDRSFAFGGTDGRGGLVTVAYVDLLGETTANITVGAGGAGSTGTITGGDGGDGVVIVEYRAA